MLALHRVSEIESSSGKADLVEDANINNLIDFSDLITVFSQSAYIALLRSKPVLMLGYMQLKNKGCTYEAFSLDAIEDKIHLALKKGYTGKQKYFFTKHVAQLLRYYLFDDMCERKVRFGKDILAIDMGDLYGNR